MFPRYETVWPSQSRLKSRDSRSGRVSIREQPQHRHASGALGRRRRLLERRELVVELGQGETG